MSSSPQPCRTVIVYKFRGLRIANGLDQGSQTRGPWAACGPRVPFVWLVMFFGNFQIINIYVAKCLEKDAAK